VGATDAIDGGGGTDTVRITATTVFGTGVTFAGVEVLDISAAVAVTLSNGQLAPFTSATGGAGASLTVNVASGANYTLPALGFTGLSLTLVGEVGAETITGLGGAESITGLDGNDLLSGNDGNDTLSGGTGDNTLSGETGADSLAAGTGADSLLGGDGADTLIAGAGSDSLTGGVGADVFVFGTGDSGTTVGSVDEVFDFQGGSDTLSLGVAGSVANYAEDLLGAVSFAGALTVADGLMNSTIRYVFVVVGSDGYLFIDRDLSGAADESIKLTGVSNMDWSDIVT
jgi:Ca2+-binding RTX toxin-like protein